MAKTACADRPRKGSNVGKKCVSHGTYRCKRHPTSPRCKS